MDEQGVIIVGHTRYKAAPKFRLETVPAHVAVGLTAAQAKVDRIADNLAAQLPDWDTDKLPLELIALQELGFDLNLTGFMNNGLNQFLASTQNEGPCDPDDVPKPPDEATTQPGDLLVLGNHRLLCCNSS